MDARALRRRYLEYLMTRVGEDDYPSGQLMDRIEGSLADEEQAGEYLELLFEKLDQTRYPSLQMLDRVERLLAELTVVAARGDGRG